MKRVVIVCLEGSEGMKTKDDLLFWGFVTKALDRAGYGICAAELRTLARDGCLRDSQRNVIVYFSSNLLSEAESIVATFCNMWAVVFVSNPEECAAAEGVTVLPASEEGIDQFIKMLQSRQPAAV